VSALCYSDAENVHLSFKDWLDGMQKTVLNSMKEADPIDGGMTNIVHQLNSHIVVEKNIFLSNNPSWSVLYAFFNTRDIYNSALEQFYLYCISNGMVKTREYITDFKLYTSSASKPTHQSYKTSGIVCPV